jgi:hypothetical protein
MRFETEYVYDPVLRNIITTRFINKWDLFSFGVGPFFGILNYVDKWWVPKFGISSFFHIEWPGVLFFEIRIDNSTFDQLREDGDYLQEMSNLSFGIYVPHAICTFNILSKQFIQRENGENSRDLTTEYQFATDIFKKNVPFRIVIGFSYLLQTRENGAAGTTDTLASVILGLRLDMNVTDFFTLTLDTRNSLYSFGLDGLLGEEISGWSGYLFKADLGFSLNISKLVTRKIINNS